MVVTLKKNSLAEAMELDHCTKKLSIDIKQDIPGCVNQFSTVSLTITQPSRAHIYSDYANTCMPNCHLIN